MRCLNAGVEIINTSLEKNLDITLFKLQKLLYLCQGLYLKTYKVPLFPEKFLNCSLGPGLIPITQKFDIDDEEIVQIEYYPNVRFNNLTGDPINLQDFPDVLLNSYDFCDQKYIKKFPFFPTPMPEILSFEKEMIENIIDTYGGFDFFELHALQRHGDFLKSLKIGNVIPNEIILNHYLYMEGILKQYLQNQLNNMSNDITEINLGIIKVKK